MTLCAQTTLTQQSALCGHCVSQVAVVSLDTALPSSGITWGTVTLPVLSHLALRTVLDYFPFTSEETGTQNRVRT